MNTKALTIVFLICLPAAAIASSADDGWRWDTRYRAERVDDAAFADEANAHTLRVRLGYLWVPDTRWSALLEGEHVAPLHERYNSTTNGRVTLPVVADPDATEVNQAWIRFTDDRAMVTAGRQRLLFDNQRFIGNVGWRQNEQTFDAVHAEFGVGSAHLRYAYLDRVHRVFGTERDHDSHLLNVGWDGLSAYAYLLDDRDAGDASDTVGLRWSGTQAPFGWTLEAARQDTLDYFLISPSVSWRGIKWTLGWERLDGDGVRGFSTPLATLHAFNGWADRFLTTPAVGLDDRHAIASGSVFGGNWVVAYRSYSAVRGDADLGHEWNASYGRALPTRLPIHWLVKVADYNGGNHAPDVRKLWLQLEWRGQ